jgi:hypothetical protein
MCRHYVGYLWFAILSFLLGPQHVYADWAGQVTEFYPLGNFLSREEGCRNAIEKAKLQAMTNAGLESITFKQFETCSSSDDKTECNLFQDTISKFEGGYISQFDVVFKEPPNEENVCRVTIDVKVKKYTDTHDFNFIFEASLDKGSSVRQNEEFNIKLEVNQPSYIHVIGWYPNLDTDHFYLLNDSMKAEGNKEYLMPMQAYFPDALNKNETHEILILVASKKPFNFLGDFVDNKQSRTTLSEQSNVDNYVTTLRDMLPYQNKELFHQRLDDLGRKEWRMVQLAYRIVK